MVMQIVEAILVLSVFLATVAGIIWATVRINRRTYLTYRPVGMMSLAYLPIGSCVRSGARRLRVSGSDAWAAGELQKIALLWQPSRQENFGRGKSALLPTRSILRQIERADAAAGLICCAQVRFPELNRLAIWLLGRRGETLGMTAVAQLRCHADVRMRREAARALARMRAWNELNRMLADPDPQVRRLATPRERKTFATRFASLAAGGISAARPSDSPATMPLVWNVAPGAGLPPKTTDWIRQILQRIQRLLGVDARSQEH